MRTQRLTHETASRGCSGIRVVSCCLAVLGILCLSGAAQAGGDLDLHGLRGHDSRGDKVCGATSVAAAKACSHELRDDYWIAVGTCANIADSGNSKECQAEAREDRKEASEECREQFEARQEVCEALEEAGRGGPYDPMLDPDEFLTEEELLVAATPNLYLPLVPGTVYRYEGGTEVTTVSVTDEVTEILGIPALAVRDVVEDEGEVVEDTIDWYAQDRAGNVWYLGEISQEFEDGELVSLEGSWKAGRDGARPGIVMLASPMVGDVYRQEFLLGDAEDIGEVLDLTASADVPLVSASCSGTCLQTADTTPLEPGILEYKFYSPDVGLILEVDPDSGARAELVSITGP
jgi:hypothetical protein